MADSFLDDPGIALSITIILFGLALALPSISFGDFGFDFAQFPSSAITIIRIGIIGLAITIGLKPLDKEGGQAPWR